MLKKYLPVLEKKLISLVLRKRGSILLYAFALMVIFSLYIFPYLNIYVSNNLVLFLIIASFLLIFQFSIQKIALLTIVMFLIGMVLFLLRDYERAENLINMVYGLIFMGIISNLYKLREKS